MQIITEYYIPHYVTFIKDTAMVFRVPEISAIASCDYNDSNLLGAVWNGIPVSAAIY